MTSDSGRRTSPTNASTSGCGTLFFIPFAGIGLVLSWMMLQDFLKDAVVWGWKETPCQIVSSSVERGTGKDDAEPYSPKIEFRYEFQFQEYRSSQVARGGEVDFSDYTAAARLVWKHPAGKESICYVNASDPHEAVLQRRALWKGLLVFFPMIFVVIGVGGIYSMWRRAPPDREKPVSSRVTGSKGMIALLLFFAIFFFVGLAAFSSIVGQPLLSILASRHWVEVPCTVQSSQLLEKSDSDGATYRVDVLYAYEFEGRKYLSSRHDLSTGFDSGRDTKRAVLRRYPAGQNATCLVNPADPLEAVLDRSWMRSMTMGLLTLIFVAAGGGGMFYAWQHMKSGKTLSYRAKAGTRSNASPDSLAEVGPAELRSKASRIGKLAMAIGIAAFWNGIVSIFVVKMIRDWRNGVGQWFLAAFLTTFVIIGARLLLAIPWQVFALFNPRPRLRVSGRAVRLGSTLEISWELPGRAHVVRRLQIFLEGREEATYQHGSTTTTDREVFAKIEIADTTEIDSIRSGSSRVTLPSELMHSFVADHNKVVWELKVMGDIPRWPEIAEEYAFEILPHA